MLIMNNHHSVRVARKLLSAKGGHYTERPACLKWRNGLLPLALNGGGEWARRTRCRRRTAQATPADKSVRATRAATRPVSFADSATRRGRKLLKQEVQSSAPI